MKQLFLLTFFLVFFIGAQSQFLVSGIVCDKQTKHPIPEVTLVLGAKQSLTDFSGKFSFTIAPNDYSLIIATEGYDFYTLDVKVGNANINLDTIFLSPKLMLPSDASGITEVSMGSGDFESSKEGQNVSGLLHSSEDVFNNVAGYNLSGFQFRVRGYDSEYEDVYINGMTMNDAENGRPTWSEWGGLNDATRNKQDVNGIEAAPFGFGNIGGATNIVTRASSIRKQNKVTYAYSNRSYNNRITYSYATGLMKNNWAYAVNFSKRWSQQGMVEGTFYDAYSYFLSAEKKLNEKHSFGISLLGAPYKRGLQSPSFQEAYDLTGNNLYNSNWGYQMGEIRNARVRTAHEPKLIFNHYWNKTSKLNITNTLGFSLSRYGTTALNWYDAPDPRPDYYRYLPSYQTEAGIINDLTSAWQNDEDKTLTQINWGKLYEINYLANATGTQAKYIIEERRDDHFRISAASNLKYQLNDKTVINGGFELQKFNGYHFKTMNDLLGGNYWVDIDQFAERDFAGDTTKLINDINNPGQKIEVGDRFGYNYTTHINQAKVWGLASITRNKVDAWFAINLGASSFSRTGNMKNGRYPTNSEGKSSVKTFFNYGLKAGATWKISGRYYVQANAAYLTKAPLINNVFTSIRISNKIIDNILMESDLAGDISFIHKGTKTNIKLTGYQTFINNQTEVVGFYHDVYRTYVNMILTNVDKVHQGIEFGMDYKLSKTFKAVAALGVGNYRYTSRPEAVISFENGSKPDTIETIYSKYFFVNGTPQTVGSIGIKYSNPKYWFIDLNANFFDNLYLDFNPERRTTGAISNIGPGDPLISEITKQEKLKGGFTLDFSLGKSWKIKKYYVGINFNVNNILGTQFKTGGFEQMRFDFETKDLSKFPPKYFYNYGRTFFLMLSVRI